ncbi:hypothetical protein SUGI_0293810 [Cryptomeria japonica]|nr:hypothetical protein SUGI_0293810 [Cryptomeria japonica]
MIIANHKHLGATKTYKSNEYETIVDMNAQWRRLFAHLNVVLTPNTSSGLFFVNRKSTKLYRKCTLCTILKHRITAVMEKQKARVSVSMKALSAAECIRTGIPTPPGIAKGARKVTVAIRVATTKSVPTHSFLS